jgi:hypothetical protein
MVVKVISADAPRELAANEARSRAAVKYWLGIAFWPTVPVTPGEFRSLEAVTPLFAAQVRVMQRRGLRRVAGEFPDDVESGPRLVSWPTHAVAPVLTFRCSRCELVSTARALSWTHSGNGVPLLQDCYVECPSCKNGEMVRFPDRPGVTS